MVNFPVKPYVDDHAVGYRPTHKYRFNNLSWIKYLIFHCAQIETLSRWKFLLKYDIDGWLGDNRSRLPLELSY